MMKNQTLIYLASPFSHKDPEILEKRWREVCEYAAELTKKGHNILCPISGSFPIEQAGLNNTDWNYWSQLDLRMLVMCDQLWVADMEGWDVSSGVRGELNVAQQFGIPIFLVRKSGALIEISDERLSYVLGISRPSDIRETIFAMGCLGHLRSLIASRFKTLSGNE